MASNVTAEQASQFALRFAGRTTAYGVYPDQKGKTPFTSDKPLPADAWDKHLRGDGPYLGIIPIREDSTCFFGAIDVDIDDIDHHTVEKNVLEHELPLVVCRSKSGAAHLYCFTRDPIPAPMMIEALNSFRKTLGYTKVNGKPIEIFPKQAVMDPKRTGNWINLPYYDHEHTNRYAVSGGRQLSLEEFFQLANDRCIDETGLAKYTKPISGPFDQGPPCLQKLHSLSFPSGGRNTGLLNAGIFFKLARANDWEDALRAYNTSIAEPVETREIDQIIRNLSREDSDKYNYTCKTHPLEAHCQYKECKKQLYGIGHFQDKKKVDSLPTLSNLVKIETVPPRYRITVNGKAIVCADDEILNPIRFKQVAFNQLDIVVPQIKQGLWDEVITELTKTMTKEEAPSEAGDSGLLMTYLHDFLAQRHKSSSIDDVALGRAAMNGDGRVYFKSTAFQEFLTRRQFRKYDSNELYTLLKDTADLTFVTKSVKGGKVKLWSVPEPKDEQSESFDYPAERHVQPSY